MNDLRYFLQKQPFRGVLKKKFSENMQHFYRRTPMLKCDFNKVAKQLYLNHTSAQVLSCKFAAHFQNTFSEKHHLRAASVSQCLFLSGCLWLDWLFFTKKWWNSYLERLLICISICQIVNFCAIIFFNFFRADFYRTFANCCKHMALSNINDEAF